MSGDATALSNNDGSGVDRLRRDASGSRFVVTVRDSAARPPDPTIGAVEALTLATHTDELRSRTWVTMQFKAPQSERPLFGYEVRVATAPITDEASFVREGRPAKTATDDIEGATALILPAGALAGQLITTTIGDLVAQTQYYVAVRAINDMNEHGPLAVAEVTTTQRTFATVSPCFIATAAYGTPLASEIGVLRQFRDRRLANNTPGRWLIAAYYKLGPHIAQFLERHHNVRTTLRSVLSSIVGILRNQR